MRLLFALLVFLTAPCLAQSTPLPAPAAREGVTMRFVQLGEFALSHAQGVEVDLINASDKSVTYDVNLLLKRVDAASGRMQEIGRVEQKGVALAAHSRRGFRVFEPLAYGRCVVEYEVLLNDAAWIKDSVKFEATGQYRMTLRPFFLESDGVFVMVESLNGEAARFRFKMLDAKTKKNLFQTENFRQIPDTTAIGDEPKRLVWQSFVGAKDLPPGDYLVQMEVFSLEDGKPVVVVTQRASPAPEEEAEI